MNLRTSLALASTLPLVILAPALATESDPLAQIYGSVVNVHNEQSGSDSAFMFQANRTFLITVNHDDRQLLISGLWGPNSDNTQVCFQPSPLGGVAVPEMQGCLPLVGHVPGDSWAALNDVGQTVDISVTSVTAPQ